MLLPSSVFVASGSGDVCLQLLGIQKRRSFPASLEIQATGSAAERLLFWPSRCCVWDEQRDNCGAAFTRHVLQAVNSSIPPHPPTPAPLPQHCNGSHESDDGGKISHNELSAEAQLGWGGAGHGALALPAKLPGPNHTSLMLTSWNADSSGTAELPMKRTAKTRASDHACRARLEPSPGGGCTPTVSR